MSLAVDSDRGKGRSRSHSRDRRSKGEPARETASYADIREPSYVYPEDDLDGRYKSSRRRDEVPGGALPYPAEGGLGPMLPGSQSLYNYDHVQPIYRTASPPQESQYRSSKDKVQSTLPGAFPEDDGSKPDSQDERRARYADNRDSQYTQGNKSSKEGPRVRYAEPRQDNYGRDGPQDDKLKFLPQKYSRTYDDEANKKKDPRTKKERDEDHLAYGKLPGPSRSAKTESPPTYGSYITGSQSQSSDKRSSQYADSNFDQQRRPNTMDADEYGSRQTLRDLPYREGPPSSKMRDDVGDPRRTSGSDREDPGSKNSHRSSQRDDPRSSKPNVLTVEPSGRDRDRSRERRRDKSPGPSSLAVGLDHRERDRSRDRRGSGRDKSPQPPAARMSSLSVDMGRPMALSLAAAPGSPLLESYHGTYQDCSPMPSPLLLASRHPSDDLRIVEALSPLNSDVEGDGKRRSRRARFHDPEDIATRIADALKGHRPPQIEPLIEVLPSLTHEQVMELRTEYKRLVKTGSERKGVNVAKHIRARLKDEDSNLMKACYSVALGKWESEAYWANFWYQGDKTRRELLIESLMGRTNYEIRQIKDAFTDKKYDNSITKCMKTELKEDKFKKAILMVLDERRMEDYDAYGRKLPIDYKLVDHDVDDLRKAVKSDKGGETLMISIIVQRSDAHLREVLQEYEHHYRANFAREALKKSGNLVVFNPLFFLSHYCISSLICTLT